MHDDKKSLRAQLRATRDQFVAEHPHAIAASPALLEKLSPDMIVASYVPLGSEADPAEITAEARALGCRIALPYVETRATPIRFIAHAPTDPLVRGAFGLEQPDPNGEELAPDVILTPLVGFDGHYNRLGQGAGHYDRAFARYEAAWRIGIAWSCQELPAIPADVWDVPLHAIITEKGMTWRNLR